jgi:hypothetical protein
MISMFRRPGLDPRSIRAGCIAPRLTPPGSRPEEHKGRVHRTRALRRPGAGGDADRAFWKGYARGLS